MRPRVVARLRNLLRAIFFAFTSGASAQSTDEWITINKDYSSQRYVDLDQINAGKAAEWQSEEQQVMAAIREAGDSKPERLLDAMRIVELANKAYFLYLKQPPQEKAKLLQMVLSNSAIDAASIYPTYRKPFDVIFQKAKTEEWRAREIRTPGPLVRRSGEHSPSS